MATRARAMTAPTTMLAIAPPDSEELASETALEVEFEEKAGVSEVEVEVLEALVWVGTETVVVAVAATMLDALLRASDGLTPLSGFSNACAQQTFCCPVVLVQSSKPLCRQHHETPSFEQSCWPAPGRVELAPVHG
jgi:hypothetical protein